MRAWAVGNPGPIATHPLEPVERAEPTPAAGEIRVAVSVCGVCRTDLHLAEGDLEPRRFGVVPGHEVVGRVDACGPGATRFSVGDRVGIAWLRHTCGVCRFCVRGDENLCVAPRFTGWDDDGGYAEWAVVDERYAYALPERVRRRARRAAALCRDHRVPSAPTVAACHAAGGSASTGSVRRRTSLRRSRCSRAQRCTCSHDRPTRSGSRSSSALRRQATRTTRLRSRSMLRSSSRRSATSCRSRCARSTVAARSPSRASTSATSRR